MKRGRQFLLIGAVIIAAAAVFVIVWQFYPSSTPTAVGTGDSIYAALTHRVTSDGAPVLGNPDALITVVEFFDYSCPHCATYRQVTNDFIRQYVAFCPVLSQSNGTPAV